MDEIDRIADQQRHRAARAPERREHADEQKDDEDIFGRPDARPEHASNRAQTIPLPQRPAHEQHQPHEQRRNDRPAERHAHEQLQAEKAQNDHNDLRIKMTFLL